MTRSAFRPTHAAIAAAILLAGCVPPPAAPPPAPAPSPTPVPTVAASAPVDWQDRAWTPGTWTYAQDARGSRALYGRPGEDAAVLVRCDRAARAIFLSRAGRSPAPFTIRTTSVTRAVAAQPTGAQPSYMAARFEVNDRLLDAMIFSRGRFTVEQPGTAPTVLPPWAELARVVEDCRG
ncbi:hypothetical protein [Sphingomonas adhaesiva]|uniref:hypothetical protein n=1 Tax=Sphingomonas adhaesiva TaxID=28212 RepID=UPI002FF9AF0F